MQLSTSLAALSPGRSPGLACTFEESAGMMFLIAECFEMAATHIWRSGISKTIWILSLLLLPLGHLMRIRTERIGVTSPGSCRYPAELYSSWPVIN
jgi:hypothetical protein